MSATSFGAPLAIEGLMAFFLEATFIGLFFFGWDKLSKLAHLTVTWLVALGSNLSALWILIANGWMQHPIGARFNPDTMRMEVDRLHGRDLQPRGASQIRAYGQRRLRHRRGVRPFHQRLYLLRGKHIEIAKRSMTVAASFGLAAALSVVVLGDESGYTAGENQKMKIAAIEAMWDTEPAPLPSLFSAFPIRRRTDRLCAQGAVGAGLDRDPLDHDAGARHQGAGRARRGAHPIGPHRLWRPRKDPLRAHNGQ